MDIEFVRKVAREKLKDFCNVCKECNGVWCAGKVPGMGGCGTGDSFKRSYNKLKRVKLILRTIHTAKDPSLETVLFGEKLSFPGIVAPITGASYNFGNAISEEEYASNIVNGAIDAGTIAMVGDGGDPKYLELGLNAIKNSRGKGIAIIKPRSNEEIIKRIRLAEKAGAIAVGIDIDGAGLLTMALHNQPVGPKSFEDLKELVSSTSLPFIVKGILSIGEAKLCQRAGVNTIVVSNHGGRILDDTLAPCEVLNGISKEVGHKMNVLVDGVVRSGGDVLKYLALGAKAVLIGRPIIWGAVGGGQEGVKITLEKFKKELYKSMILTGCESSIKVPSNIIHEFLID